MTKNGDDKHDKFHGVSYDTWAYRVRSKLEAKQLWKYVEPGVILPTGASGLEQEAHKLKLAQAKEKIVKNLETSIIELIETLEDPHEIWETLESIYLKKQFGNVVQEFFNYMNIRFDPTKDMLTHVNSLRQHARSIKDMAGFEIPEQLQVLFWLYSVKDVFGSLVDAIKMRDKILDRNELSKILLTKYEEWKVERKDQEGQLGTALVGKNQKKQSGNIDKYDKKPRGNCYYCDKPNHTKSICRRRINDEKNGIYRNNIHTPAYGAFQKPQEYKYDRKNEHGDYRQRNYKHDDYRQKNYRSPRRSNEDTDGKRKYANTGYQMYTGEYENEKKEMKRSRKDSDDENERVSKRSRSESRGETQNIILTVRLVHDTEQNIDLCLPHNIFVHRMTESIALECVMKSTRCKNNTWIIDSGATRHMTFERRYFVNLKSYSGEIYVADNRSIEIEGIGDVKLNVNSINSVMTIYLKNVYYVPRLEFNLLSIPAATKNKQMSFIFNNPENATIQLQSGETIIAKKLPICYLYYFEVNQPKGFGLVTYPTQDHKLKMWHERFGHPGKSVMHKLNEEFQLNISSKSIDNLYCEACIKGKMTKLPFKTVEKHTERFLQKVCGDVYYVECPSYDGYRYYVVLIDDHTSFSFIIRLRTRNEFKLKLESWYKEVTEGGKYKLECIQLDRAGEFIDKDINEFCTAHGVHAQYSLARQHQQNGLAERKIRTLNDKMRTMLIAGNFPLSLWSEAIVTANDLSNLSPAKRNRNRKSPYYMRFGQPPSIIRMRRFGCIAWAYVDLELRTKLEPRAVKCIFVGYLKDSKGYRLLTVDTLKPILTRNVIFIEDLMPTIRIQSPHVSVPQLRDVEPRSNESSIDSLFRHVESSENTVSPVNTSSTEMSIRSDQPSISQERPTEVTNGGAIDQTENLSHENVTETVKRKGVPMLIDDRQEKRSKPLDLEQSERLERLFSDKDNELKEKVTNTGFDTSLAEKLRKQSENLVKMREQHTQKKLNECIKNLEEGKEIPKDYTGLIYCLLGKRVKAKDAKEIGLPSTIDEAINSPYKQNWIEATDSEMDSLRDNNTWILVPRPKDHNVLKNKWVFVIKRKEDGRIERFKARLVIKGYEEEFGIDYDDIFSPVLRFETLRFLLTLGATLDYSIHQMDVKTAFLNGEIDKIIYMEQPPGYVKRGEEHLVCLLKKSLYGLKQAPRIWNKLLTKTLKRYGFEQLHSDECVFIRQASNGLEIVTIYVDDLIILTPTDEQTTEIKELLRKSFEMKDLGPIHYILGWKITRNRENRTITISQESYVDTILEKFHFTDCNATKIPIDPGLRLSKEMAPKTDKEKLEMRNKPYREIVGSLMYLTIGTRPDLAFLTHELSKFVTNPGLKHWGAAKNGLRYLKGTKNYGLVLGGKIQKQNMSKLQINIKELALRGLSDADFANSIDDRRSVAGILVELWNSPIAWTSKIQPSVALSTTEAEYMALCKLTQELFYFRNLCKEMNLPLKEPITMMEDNNSCIKIAENDEFHQRTKHIDLRYHFIRDAIKDRIVRIEKVDSKENIADIFTKPLPRIQFQRLREKLRLRPLESKEIPV